jgi:uncharacterized membrane protein (UPF0182 family)
MSMGGELDGCTFTGNTAASDFGRCMMMRMRMMMVVMMIVSDCGGCSLTTREHALICLARDVMPLSGVGGAVEAAGKLVARGCVFTSNSVVGMSKEGSYGGAVHSDSFEAADCQFTGNKAGE